MSTRKHFSTMALATAAAVLFSSAPLVAAAADSAKVKCDGGNSCKGKSECSTPTNACAGQNACKGQGYVMMEKAACTAAQAVNKPAAKKT